jgi:predicted DNA repair protein MutK
MAGASLFALIDDIASLLDDVASMSKVALKKTSGVLGDDLALNAEQVSGIDANREIPVVLKVAKGSAINKLILVPVALGLSQFLPGAIKPLLIFGGVFLCYEGVEKIFHNLFGGAKGETDSKLPVSEADRIKGAVTTDFVLSAEIIVITLGTLTATTFIEKLSVLSLISVVMTVGVYGLVAGIIKLDDLGFYLMRSAKSWAKAIGRGVLVFAPLLMKFLSFFGTLAMFLVGGGILTHGIGVLHHWSASLLDFFGLDATGWKATVTTSVFDLFAGFLAGVLAVIVMIVVKRVFKGLKS